MRPWAPVALLAAALAGGPAGAQDAVVTGNGATLRGLDKVDGDVVDMPVANGGAAEFGRLSIALRECRYPADNLSEAYAFVTIRDIGSDHVFFEGWMVASSPALNALEHPRYDVWVLSCKTG